MKIALIGYGKMGKAIEEIALERGHTIIAKINTQHPIESSEIFEADVAIEFSRPDKVVDHIQYCLDGSIPIVVGTTAWQAHFEAIKEQTLAANGSLLYASNFSIGVNIFFELNKKLAQLMHGKFDYTASMDEIHHLQKLDAPSGTAITLAHGIMENNEDYSSWVLGEEKNPYTTDGQLGITSYRQPDVPGTHSIHYKSDVDTISISHEAHSRKGFALGAVIAAEWLQKKKGVFTMNDVLNF
jgi:4-hydroxy-tetrahydrodipicolinate reductase